MVALSGLLAAAGCTPGPVTARTAPDMMTGARSAGGADVRVVVRDAAGAEVDAPVDAKAGAPDAAAETPKLPRPDAATDRAAAPIPDAAPVDRAPDRPGARAPRAGEIVIDELLVNPTGDDLGREWVEIESRATEPLDLAQLHLATASTDVPVAAGTLAPGALLLLGQSNDPSKNGGAPVSVTYSTKLILTNTSGQLSLCLGACASGVVIDQVTWDALDDSYVGHALVIDPATGISCPASAPFGTGGSFGTPGVANPPCTQNIDAGSQRDVSVAD
jgi:hypothetical protein